MLTLEQAKALSYNKAREACRSGELSYEDFLTYCHLWQTTSLRLSTTFRACDCESCKTNFPLDCELQSIQACESVHAELFETTNNRI